MDFFFSLEQASVSRALSLHRDPALKLVKPFWMFFLGVSIVACAGFLFGFFLSVFSEQRTVEFFAILLISFPLFLSTWIAERFFFSYLTLPRPTIPLAKALEDPSQQNMAEFLTFESAQIMEEAQRLTEEESCKTLSSLSVLYGMCTASHDLDFIFSRTGIQKDTLAKNIRATCRTQDFSQSREDSSFQETLSTAFSIAVQKGHDHVHPSDIFLAVAKVDLLFQRVLLDAGIKYPDLETVVWWLEQVYKERARSRKFWEWENLLQRGSIARTWTAGYTPTLDKFSTDVSSSIQRRTFFHRHIGHTDEIKAMERILTKQTINNVLLVGEPGSGRKSTIYAFVERSGFGKSLPHLNYKRVVLLDMPSVIAYTESTEGLETLLDKIFREVVRAGNIILVLDQFHNYVGSEQSPGTMNISGILYPYLSSSQFQMIGITSHEGLHGSIEKNPSVANLFERVETREVTGQETLFILQYIALSFEHKHSVFITFQALVRIIESAKYLPSSAMPEKAIRLLDEVVSYVVQTKEKVVLPEHVTKIIKDITHIPTGELEEEEKEKLLHLEDLLKERIVGQEESIQKISSALRRARSGVNIKQGPIGTFLFLGPTGVGKTETAKALASIYFGSESRIIRLDMSEFQNIADIKKLLGGDSKEGETFTTQVREAPFSLILLDEIEKAHPNVLHLFLQVLDEGHLTDGFGRKIDFTNTIIIATSNAGANIILDSIKEKGDWEKVKDQIMDHVFQQDIFRPEFINRFDAVVLYKPLTRENLLSIASRLLGELKENLREKGVDFQVSDELIAVIAKLGYNPSFGARHMRRVIQQKVQDPIAQGLLEGMITKGTTITIDPESFQVSVSQE